eukprot:scaffold201_cov121-Isochrysis_galbana.AAC.6
MCTSHPGQLVYPARATDGCIDTAAFLRESGPAAHTPWECSRGCSSDASLSTHEASKIERHGWPSPPDEDAVALAVKGQRGAVLCDVASMKCSVTNE